MTLSIVDSETNGKSFEIPRLLKGLLATAVVVLDEQGYVLECNRGFHFLVDQGEAPDDDWNVRNCFIQPHFIDFLNVYTGQANQSHEPVYQGIINIGNVNGGCRSINGAVYRHQERLLIIGEHDIVDLEKLSASVIKLNNELAQTQRDLAKANRKLKRDEEKITKLMLADPMTGIPNRRHFDQRSEEEVMRHRRIKHPLCFVMVDIDLFKDVNDAYGHDVGDVVICRLAQVMSETKRTGDFVARVGGEEFIILLPHTEISKAQIVADRVRVLFSRQVYDGIDHPITASFGIAELQANDTVESLIKRSDQCLYVAKEGGRNQVVSKLPLTE